MELVSIKLEDGYTMFMDYEEYLEAKEAFDFLELDYQVEKVTDKIYRIKWYDYMDEEWRDIWCTSDEYESNLAKVLDAKIAFIVKVYNQ